MNYFAIIIDAQGRPTLHGPYKDAQTAGDEEELSSMQLEHALKGWVEKKYPDSGVVVTIAIRTPQV
jgi:hypothetical protein